MPHKPHALRWASNNRRLQIHINHLKKHVMSNPIEQLLNQMIQNALPSINGAIKNQIISNNLDPWGQVASGSDTLGSINLGICDASCNANYNVGNMTGLSSFAINSIVLSQTQTDPTDPSKLVGMVQVNASLGSNLSAGVGGGIEAKCGFIHPSVGINGSATISGINGLANGSFVATVSSGQVCLSSASISTMAISCDNINVSVDGLGIFSFLLDPLVNAIVGLFRGQITSAIGSAVTPVLNSKINGILPICQNL
jgi:hypothetical protein